ncbi:hypothetical protein PA0839 [Candidatus Phytoplasma australiense]|uniref:Uncharacterized protein n=1 Tax=Phytoplasma australiense TaxID=59748 RepID=B1VB50_PHYAS|nr:hypothetical protein PA0839 [Candidatus Phytoplasma australiense]
MQNKKLEEDIKKEERKIFEENKYKKSLTNEKLVFLLFNDEIMYISALYYYPKNENKKREKNN